MDAIDLRTFEAVARLGSMSRAGAELNTVQSNVTTRIRNLESELGVPLFERHSRGVALTPAGRRLLPFANAAARLLEDARRATLDDGRPSGMLVVGSLETTAALRLTPLLSEFSASYPEVDLVLRTGTTAELVDQVLSGQIEGAFVCGPVEHVDLVAELSFVEELAVLTSPRIESLDTLHTLPDLKIIVLRAGCSYRQRLEAALARRGVVGLRLLEFGTLETIANCVASGLGITLLPKTLLGQVWAKGRMAAHTLPPEEAFVETVFIRRRDAHPSSALRAFVTTARPGAAREAAE